jgi:hypothetical protein
VTARLAESCIISLTLSVCTFSSTSISFQRLRCGKRRFVSDRVFDGDLTIKQRLRLHGKRGFIGECSFLQKVDMRERVHR